MPTAAPNPGATSCEEVPGAGADLDHRPRRTTEALGQVRRELCREALEAAGEVQRVLVVTVVGCERRVEGRVVEHPAARADLQVDPASGHRSGFVRGHREGVAQGRHLVDLDDRQAVARAAHRAGHDASRRDEAASRWFDGCMDLRSVTRGAVRSMESAGRELWRTQVLRTAVDVTDEVARASCLVLAPHPDDETLGCGATIARKRCARHPGAGRRGRRRTHVPPLDE